MPEAGARAILPMSGAAATREGPAPALRGQNGADRTAPQAALTTEESRQVP